MGSATATAEPRSSNAVNAIIHLYRADVGRLTAYRARLDTTTNWAITSTALVTIYALTNAAISHGAFVFLMISNLFFLRLEARRFGFYLIIRRRVQLIEPHFFRETVEGVARGGWLESALNALEVGEAPLSLLEAIGWRLRRNYGPIFAAVLTVWLVKLGWSSGDNLASFAARAAIAGLPGWAVIAAVAGLHLWLVWLALSAVRHRSFGAD